MKNLGDFRIELSPRDQISEDEVDAISKLIATWIVKISTSGRFQDDEAKPTNYPWIGDGYPGKKYVK